MSVSNAWRACWKCLGLDTTNGGPAPPDVSTFRGRVLPLSLPEVVDLRHRFSSPLRPATGCGRRYTGDTDRGCGDPAGEQTSFRKERTPVHRKLLRLLPI